MGVNYKKELESAAKSMILVHDPNTLMKMIVRMIVQRVKVAHAAILLHCGYSNSYVLRISRGARGVKIPEGFARINVDNPLIYFFCNSAYKNIFTDRILVYRQAKKILKKKVDPELYQFLNHALEQMDIFGVDVCIPSYFRNELLGLLFLGKRKGFRNFSQKELDFLLALASDVAMAIRNAQLFKELEQELDKKQRLFFQTTIALAAAIDAKDHYTRGHTTRVTSISIEIAKRLNFKNKKIYTEKFFEQLHIAGLLHDIGKIAVPETILNKKGPLDYLEWQKIKEHPAAGVMILTPINELNEATQGVKYHHENYDGSGYPEGLKGNEIPLIASIIAVADAFDAMTNDRPYRSRLSKQEAVNEIKKEIGRQFNPEISAILFELYEENKI